MWLFVGPHLLIIVIISLIIAYLADLASSFLVDLSHATHTQIVHPRIITDRTIRRRRDIYSNIYIEESSGFKVVEIGDWSIELNSIDNLLIRPGLQAEWISSNEKSSLKVIQQCNYKLGTVRAFETSSRAAIAVCNSQITGYVKIGDLMYFLQPLNGSNDAHILYSIRLVVPVIFYNKKYLHHFNADNRMTCFLALILNSVMVAPSARQALIIFPTNFYKTKIGFLI